MILGMAMGCSNTSEDSGEKQVIELRLAHFFPVPAAKRSNTTLDRGHRRGYGRTGENRELPQSDLLNADSICWGSRWQYRPGSFLFSYTRGRFPVLEVFELPGISYMNSKVASQVAWEGIKELNPHEIQDTKLLMVFTTGPGDLYTRTAVRKLEDLKGMEIRATGLSATTLQALGAVPSAMPQSDAYEALTKGVVKGNLG